MFALTNLIGCAAAPQTPATITLAGDVQSTTGATPKTFTAAPIGAAAADRYVAVVVSYSSGASGNAQNMGISTYAVTGLQSTTATDSQTTDTDAAAMNLLILEGGVALGGAVNANATDRTFTTTGLTEDVDKAIETGIVTYTSSSVVSPNQQTLPVVVDCSATDAGKYAAGCVSFR